MSNTDKIKVLKQKRGVIKAQITNFKKFLEQYKKEDPNLIKLSLRLEKYKSSYQGLDEIQDELELLDAENVTDLMTERFEIQDEYFNVLSEAEQLVIAVTRPPQNINTSVSNLTARLNAASITLDNTNNEAPAQSARSRRVKLSEATLPSFSGRYEE